MFKFFDPRFVIHTSNKVTLQCECKSPVYSVLYYGSFGK